MNIPNALTLSRIALTPILFTLLISSPSSDLTLPVKPLVIFLIAAGTDALDGFLARIWNQVTELGSFLDPLADKLLIISAFLGIGLTHASIMKPPLWIQVTVIFRELVIFIGFLTFLFFAKKTGDFRPNFLGKLTTCAQLFFILMCLMRIPGATPFAYITAALTIASCLVYTLRGVQILSQRG